ncbi:hypothetical protein COU80_03445 [Candidatus Peregrinibacteria bacterium CG10_big_fil_rev_8_21_14_0_10_55_24]|nr:MAG: hypothetical protein COU80_03445 [Candidatus Peregrinibacteria bacterium CG10_big_fil_rev_8_21_14_0_10_55_24]
MLPRSQHQHVASNNPLAREDRLLWFAKDDGANSQQGATGGNLSEDTTPPRNEDERLDEGAQDAPETQGPSTRENLTAATETFAERVREASVDREELLASQELWNTAAYEMGDDRITERIRTIAQRDGLTVETMVRSPDTRRSVMTELLDDPEVALLLARRTSGRLQEFRELVSALGRTDKTALFHKSRSEILDALERKVAALRAQDASLQQEDAAVALHSRHDPSEPYGALEEWLRKATRPGASPTELEEVNSVFGTSFAAAPSPDVVEFLLNIIKSIEQTNWRRRTFLSYFWGRNIAAEAEEEKRRRARTQFLHDLERMDRALRDDLRQQALRRAEILCAKRRDEFSALVREPFNRAVEAYRTERGITGELTPDQYHEVRNAFAQQFREQHGVALASYEAAFDAIAELGVRADTRELVGLSHMSDAEIARRYPEKEEAIREARDNARVMLRRISGRELLEAEDPQFFGSVEIFSQKLTEAEPATTLAEARTNTQGTLQESEALRSDLSEALEILSDEGGEEILETAAESAGIEPEELRRMLEHALDAWHDLEPRDWHAVSPLVDAILSAYEEGVGLEAQHIATEEPRKNAAIETARRDLLARWEATQEHLHRTEEFAVCRLLQVPQELARVNAEARAALRDGPGGRINAYLEAKKTDQAREELALARATVEHLEHVAQALREPPPVTEYVDTSPESSYGYYKRTEHKIYINTHRCKDPKQREETVRHEWGHAVLYALSRDARFSPLEAAYRSTARFAHRNQTNFETLLEEASRTWGITQRFEAALASAAEQDLPELERQKREAQMEELLTTYATMEEQRTARKREREAAARQGDPETAWPRPFHAQTAGYSEAEVALFDLLDRKYGHSELKTDAFTDVDNDLTSAPIAIEEMHQRGRHAHEEDEDDEERQPPVVEQESTMREDLIDCETMLHNLELSANVDELAELREDLFARTARGYAHLRRLQEAYATGISPWTGRPFDPEGNDEEAKRFQRATTQFKNHLDELTKKLQTMVLRPMRDLSDAAQKRRRKWNFVSILDVVRSFKSGYEDLKRMWERKSKQSSSIFGKWATGWIPKNIWYFGRLQNEFDRRAEDDEAEEVGVWEKALKNMGPNQLIDQLQYISSPRHKDQLKAIMNLLSKLGRIDWDNEEIWRAMSAVSPHYTMPFSICRYDRFAREEWMKKLVQDIWDDDKELYMTWFSQNSRSFTSKRDEYESFADVRSNVSGEMPAVLARQLQIFTEWAHQGSLPEDANPYIYEKCIQYAMKFGKMTMEEKFFYLIKGIEVGILPIERLNLLNKELLVNFPFMDFFTRKNNSIHEIRRMAAQITEPAPNQFKPGLRAKVWLQFVVARDEDTRSRAAKIMSRAGDSIDHEDIPMMTTIFDQGDMNELLSVIRGSQQRVTQEGLKNAYVGYGTVFRSLGYVARLSKIPRSRVRFTNRDASIAGARMLAYNLFDNLVAGGTPMDRRPNLSWRKINSESMPSGGGETPRTFRDPINALIFDVFRRYNITHIDLPAEDKEPARLLSIQDYLGASRGPKDVSKKDLLRATPHIELKLLERISSNPQPLVEALAEHAESIPNEGGSDAQITEEDVIRMRSMIAQQQQ